MPEFCALEFLSLGFGVPELRLGSFVIQAKLQSERCKWFEVGRLELDSGIRQRRALKS